MSNGERIKKVVKLLQVLQDMPPSNATLISAAAELSHGTVLDWLYALHAAGLVEMHRVKPRKWGWRKK